MNPKINAKAYAAGIAAFVGSLVLILSSQPEGRQGIEFMTQLQWGNVILYVLASYGITWRVPNASAVGDTQPPKQGSHVA